MSVDIIHNENCLDTMSLMSDGWVDLVVTSPPYDGLRKYNGYSFDFEHVAQELYRVVKPGGVVVWVVSDQTVKGTETLSSFKQAIYFSSCGFNIHDTMIYMKQNYKPMTHNRYEQQFEYMFVLSKGRPETFNPIMDPVKYPRSRTLKMRDGDGFKYTRQEPNTHKIRGNVWSYKTGGGHVSDQKVAHKHPAICPIQLVRDHITTWSNPGEIVYDPFMGSGTTAVAAIEYKRLYVGSEISDEYCKLANDRIQSMIPSLPIGDTKV